MEKLLCNPALLEIKCVSDYAPTVRTFGSSVRMLAQERLLAAIVEKNQAAMANSLQVFYNMDSLPEILLLVVDSTVKRTVDASRAALDVEGIHALLHEGGAHHVGGVAGLQAVVAGSVPMSASKKPSAAAASAGAGGAAGGELRSSRHLSPLTFRSYANVRVSTIPLPLCTQRVPRSCAQLSARLLTCGPVWCTRWRCRFTPCSAWWPRRRTPLLTRSS
jgi:hypothetical protein